MCDANKVRVVCSVCADYYCYHYGCSCENYANEVSFSRLEIEERMDGVKAKHSAFKGILGRNISRIVSLSR